MTDTHSSLRRGLDITRLPNRDQPFGILREVRVGPESLIQIHPLRPPTPTTGSARAPAPPRPPAPVIGIRLLDPSPPGLVGLRGHWPRAVVVLRLDQNAWPREIAGSLDLTPAGQPRRATGRSPGHRWACLRLAPAAVRFCRSLMRRTRGSVCSVSGGRVSSRERAHRHGLRVVVGLGRVEPLRTLVAAALASSLAEVVTPELRAPSCSHPSCRRSAAGFRPG